MHVQSIKLNWFNVQYILLQRTELFSEVTWALITTDSET